MPEPTAPSWVLLLDGLCPSAGLGSYPGSAQESRAQIFWGSHSGALGVGVSLWTHWARAGFGEGHKDGGSPCACSSKELMGLLPSEPRPSASSACLSNVMLTPDPVL